MSVPSSAKTTFEASTLRAVDHLASADPVMRAIIAAVGPCTLSPAWQRSPFEALVRAVAYQQLQGKAAEAILGRFVSLFAPAAFPTPLEIQTLDDEILRAVGFSRAKSAAIRDIAAKTISGVVPSRSEAEAMDDAELIRRLISIRGVGQWTVEMLLIFSLGRLDVFPLDDFGVKNGIRKAYGLAALPAKRDMLGIAECWRPYRSIASWYLWRAAEGARRSTAQAAPLP